MQIKSFLGDCSCNERERSYSLEQKPYLETQQEKRRAQMKQLSSSSKETPGTIPQHSVENPTPHHHLTQTTSSTAPAHTSISDCQGLFPCQAHTTASSLPRQTCLHLCKPHRRYLMLPRAPCWPQLHCPHAEASADWGLCPRQLQPLGLHLSLMGPDPREQHMVSKGTHTHEGLRRVQTPPQRGGRLSERLSSSQSSS